MRIEINKLLFMKRIISFLFAICFSLFSNSFSSFADELNEKIETQISNEKEEVKLDVNKKANIANSSLEDIFGDEQTFPFVAGLGKNAAH